MVALGILVPSVEVRTLLPQLSHIIFSHGTWQTTSVTGHPERVRHDFHHGFRLHNQPNLLPFPGRRFLLARIPDASCVMGRASSPRHDFPLVPFHSGNIVSLLLRQAAFQRGFPGKRLCEDIPEGHRSLPYRIGLQWLLQA